MIPEAFGLGLSDVPTDTLDIAVDEYGWPTGTIGTEWPESVTETENAGSGDNRSSDNRSGEHRSGEHRSGETLSGDGQNSDRQNNDAGHDQSAIERWRLGDLGDLSILLLLICLVLIQAATLAATSDSTINLGLENKEGAQGIHTCELLTPCNGMKRGRGIKRGRRSLN